MTSPSLAGSSGKADSSRPKWRYRFGLRWLLVAVTLAALAVGWIGYEHRRAQGQTALVAELAEVGVVVGLEEPTGVGLVVRKFFPDREAWLRERIGPGWFYRPAEFVIWRLEADQVEFAAQRLNRLGTVREVQLRTPQSEAQIDRLRSELPGTLVLDSHQLASRPTTPPTARFATAGVRIMGALVIALVCVTALLAWPLFARSR
jgi:hypothetical protein